jgi:predicted phage tail protein
VIWDWPWKIFRQFQWAANFLVCPRLGHQTKTHVNYILHKDINNKSKQNYPNYQMQMMLLKPVLCFIQQQEVVKSQQIQPTGEQLSIIIGDECVGQACGGIMYVNTVTMFILASFFYYKIVFSQFRLGGWVMK